MCTSNLILPLQPINNFLKTHYSMTVAICSHRCLGYTTFTLMCDFLCSLGWWFVSVGAEEGWAPCSYLERLNGKDEEEETISSLGKQLWNMCGIWKLVMEYWSLFSVHPVAMHLIIHVYNLPQFFMWLSHTRPHDLKSAEIWSILLYRNLLKIV